MIGELEFQQEISALSFLGSLGYQAPVFEMEDVEGLATSCVATFVNIRADRELWLAYGALNSGDKPPALTVRIRKISRKADLYARPENGFFFDDYMKQYHKIDLHPGFNLDAYQGTTRERIRLMLEHLAQLLTQFAMPVIRGEEWPYVEFDWQGLR